MACRNRRNVSFFIITPRLRLCYFTYRDAPNYKNYGCTLEIVTDRSQEGAQFVKGFGGIGGKSQTIKTCL